jgi:hypothetical protein
MAQYMHKCFNFNHDCIFGIHIAGIFFLMEEVLNFTTIQVFLAICGGYVPIFYECEQQNREYHVQVYFISRVLGSTKFQYEKSKLRLTKPRIERATCSHKITRFIQLASHTAVPKQVHYYPKGPLSMFFSRQIMKFFEHKNG